MIPIEIHPEASEELEQAVRWYQVRSIRAARRFVLAVDDAIHKIRETPNRFFQIDRRHRACNLSKFPFQIVFRDDDQKIVVIAVAHAKRRPSYWRHRSPTQP